MNPATVAERETKRLGKLINANNREIKRLIAEGGSPDQLLKDNEMLAAQLLAVIREATRGKASG